MVLQDSDSKSMFTAITSEVFYFPRKHKRIEQDLTCMRNLYFVSTYCSKSIHVLSKDINMYILDILIILRHNISTS